MKRARTACLMGAGRVDNAAPQYGIAAFVAFSLYGTVGIEAVVLGGLEAQWMLVSCNTDVVVVPAFVVFLVLSMRHGQPGGVTSYRRGPHNYVAALSIVAGAAALAGVPMLIKNWILVGCQLAPQFGCGDTYWASAFTHVIAALQILSLTDLLPHPFAWTLVERSNMLGNASALLLTLIPFVWFFPGSELTA